MVKTKKTARTGGKWRGKSGQGPPNGLLKVFVHSSSSGPASHNDDTADATFSLRDAAHNTDRHRAGRANLGQNLRSQAIGFVRSSDPLEGTLTDETQPRTWSSKPQTESRSLQPQNLHNTSSTDRLPPHRLARPSSSSLSDSSEEVVVFAGRRALPQDFPASQVFETEKPTTRAPKHSPEDLTPTSGSLQQDSGLFSAEPSSKIVRKHWKPDTLAYCERQLSTHNHSRPTKRKNDNGNELQRTTSQGEEGDSDAVLADYMDNMRAYGEIDDDFVLQAHALDANLDGWSRSELVDFTDLSTSTEVADALDSVLAKRSRASGIQYLVVWQGQSADEARWIHHESLSMDGASELIHAFEKREMIIQDSKDASQRNELNEADFDTAEDRDDGSSYEEDEDFDDERDLLERRIARMTDEQIARLLTKQEELGMGSDELMLFDGLGDTLATDSDISDGDDEGFIAFQSPRHRGKITSFRKKSSISPFEPFREAAREPMGDDYGEFDVMDFHRPSLGNRSILQGTDATFGLSDSDLEADLRDQFAADRKKKKAKKQEREELRAQGLLGKKNKFKPDMAARYNDGLSIPQFKEELEEFLFSGQESLALPPMAKRERKIIHEIASQFNLKSKSVGSGKSRFPVLYKTSRTTGFDAATFKRVERRFQRSFLPRMDNAGKGKARLPARRSGGGGITSGTGYAEGETVGATAAELGSENRGRAMLEKMGWSTGMALGAMDNKGILQPISHVVKKTRAGLG